MKKFLIIFAIPFFVISYYLAVIKPNQWLAKVEKDFNYTKQQLGSPSEIWFRKDDCNKLQFINCQQMISQNIEKIYIWHKGLDVNIVAGFDQNDTLKFKQIVINEQLTLND